MLDRADPRWLDAARTVIPRHVPQSSRPVRGLLLTEIEERLAQQHGRDEVSIPKQTTGYELPGTRSGDERVPRQHEGEAVHREPAPGGLRRLRATRPGEYVVLDTNSLDVFAMEPVTCRWVQGELTVAMDLYSKVHHRAAADAGIDEVDRRGRGPVRDDSSTAAPRGTGEPLPYCGVPSTVVFDAEKLVDARRAAAAAVGRGGDDHLRPRPDLRLEPHRERLREVRHLAAARPSLYADRQAGGAVVQDAEPRAAGGSAGLQGPDVHSRGENVENEAYFFLDELEAIIREWITCIYHRRHHRGLTVPEVPGLELSPLEMFKHGVNRAGPLRIPARPGLAFEFLEEEWCPIHHYGVEINGLRYNGDGLDDYRNQISPHRGEHAGKWPVTVDRADIRKIYFQDPKQPHLLAHPGLGACPGIERAGQLGGVEVRAPDRGQDPSFPGHQTRPDRVAGALGCRADRGPDRAAHGGALVAGPSTDGRRRRLRGRQDRRASLRAPSGSAQSPDAGAGQEAAPDLQVVASADEDLGGDDDEDEECEAVPADEETAVLVDEDEYYADVWESR